jgi:hypothetical protein
MDISAHLPMSPDGDSYIFFFFEHVSTYPVLSFRPSKSAADFLASVDHLRATIRALCPDGTRLRLLTGDFDPTWAVQGRPDHTLTSQVRAHADLHNYTVSPFPPYSQSLNHAEPLIRRLSALALANAVRANLSFLPVATDMYRGAQAQSRLHLVDISNCRITRHQALTGLKPDVSTFPSYPGALAWMFQPDGKASAGRPRAISGYYVCPDTVNPGSWCRAWGSLKLSFTRLFSIVKDHQVRALLACVATTSLPRGPLSDPPPTTYDSSISRLLHSYPTESDVHTTAVRHDPISGVPTSIINFAPSLLDDGSIEMIELPAPPALPFNLLRINAEQAADAELEPAAPAHRPRQPGAFHAEGIVVSHDHCLCGKTGC